MMVLTANRVGIKHPPCGLHRRVHGSEPVPGSVHRSPSCCPKRFAVFWILSGALTSVVASRPDVRSLRHRRWSSWPQNMPRTSFPTPRIERHGRSARARPFPARGSPAATDERETAPGVAAPVSSPRGRMRITVVDSDRVPICATTTYTTTYAVVGHAPARQCFRIVVIPRNAAKCCAKILCMTNGPCPFARRDHCFRKLISLSLSLFWCNPFLRPRPSSVE